MEQGLASNVNNQELLAKIVNMIMQGASLEDLAAQGVPIELLEQAMMLVEAQMQGGM